MSNLEIVYQDAFIVAINKPHNLLVHRSKIATNTEIYALQLLRDQIKQRVYPVHRLDAKTSGVLVFALTADVNSMLQKQFSSHVVQKTYIAIVRGFTPDDGTIDYPLTNEKKKTQDAVTHFSTLQTTEIDVAFGKHATSRYSLVQIKPTTGRFHQIRKHFAHLRHPIIGDRPHGCNKQNKLFKEKWSMPTMMLHAQEIEFMHPITNEPLKLTAQIHDEFQRTKEILGF